MADNIDSSIAKRYHFAENHKMAAQIKGDKDKLSGTDRKCDERHFGAQGLRGGSTVPQAAWGRLTPLGDALRRAGWKLGSYKLA
jgi:hypothetical protein